MQVRPFLNAGRYTYCKARNEEGNAIALGLLREIAARIGLSGKSL
ncbi:MAG: hypothetical protein ACYCS8_12910 [Acidithiobacillus sp.]